MARELDTGYDSKNNRWEVYKAERGNWRWDKFNDKKRLLAASKRAFKSKEECKEDAEYHGMDGDYHTLLQSS